MEVRALLRLSGALLALLALSLAGAALTDAQPTDDSSFPPGWNGEARKPPMGWRSWNCFGAGVSDVLMRTAIDAVTARNWTVDGKKVSLADVGYSTGTCRSS